MLSSHLFLCLPQTSLSFPCTDPCRVVLAGRFDLVTCPLHFFTMVRRSLMRPYYLCNFALYLGICEVIFVWDAEEPVEAFHLCCLRPSLQSGCRCRFTHRLIKILKLLLTASVWSLSWAWCFCHAIPNRPPFCHGSCCFCNSGENCWSWPFIWVNWSNYLKLLTVSSFLPQTLISVSISSASLTRLWSPFRRLQMLCQAVPLIRYGTCSKLIGIPIFF